MMDGMFRAVWEFILNARMRTTNDTKKHETKESCGCLPVHLMDALMNTQNSLIFVRFRAFRGFLFSF
jgi:hypothetical protein